MIEIVEGEPDRVATIMPVMEDSFDPQFGEAWTSSQCLSALAMPGCRLLLAQMGGDTVGFAMSRWVLDTEELLMIGVSSKWQRHNIGKSLLDRIVEIARFSERIRLFLEVRDGNSAYRFYTAYGFKPVGVRKEYYKGLNGNRHDAITMAFDL